MSAVTSVLATPAASGLTAIDLRIALQSLGTVKEVTPRQNGASFRISFVEPVRSFPAEKAVKGIRVTLRPDVPSNIFKGTVYSRELEGCSAESVRGMILSSAVKNVECVPTRFRATDSGRFRITFDTPVPEHVTLNCGLSLEVRKLDPLPLRCLRCFEYWHHEDRCQSKHQLCDVCGLPAHPTKACKRTFCVACKVQGHSVKSTSCPQWTQARETARIRRQEDVPLGDAIKKAAAQFPSLPPTKGKAAPAATAPKQAQVQAKNTTAAVANPVRNVTSAPVSYAATVSPSKSLPAGAAPTPAVNDTSSALLEVITTMQKQMEQQQAIIVRLEKLLVQQSETTAKLVEQNSAIIAALTSATAPAKVSKRGRPAKTDDNSPDSQKPKRLSTIPRMFLNAAPVDSDDTMSPCPSPTPMIVDLGDNPDSQGLAVHNKEKIVGGKNGTG